MQLPVALLRFYVVILSEGVAGMKCWAHLRLMYGCSTVHVFVTGRAIWPAAFETRGAGPRVRLVWGTQNVDIQGGV
jgi:hypothetical protein